MAGGVTVLVAHHRPDALDSLKLAFRDTAYTILAASTSEEALSLARAAHPALALLDVALKPADGFTVCRTLRAENGTREMRVIYLGDTDEEEDLARAFAEGGYDYMISPFAAGQVRARAETWLMRHQGRRTGDRRRGERRSLDLGPPQGAERRQGGDRRRGERRRS